jgi:membrane protease YdiL (CAAX protease family)
MTTELPPAPPQNFARRYWSESRRPWVSLVFVAPMLIAYEIGVWLFGVKMNGADLWMRQLLNLLGLSQHLLLPAMTAGILLGWHYLNHEKWRFSVGALSGMIVECLMLALALQLLGSVMQGIATAPGLVIGEKVREFVGFFGAGIYEELLFRLILLSGLWWLLRHYWTRTWKSLATAVLASSLLFALAHYVGPGGEELKGFTFLFRFLAGVFFAVVFVYRGFGIAAGSHALYDILVGLFTK